MLGLQLVDLEYSEIKRSKKVKGIIYPSIVAKWLTLS